MRLKKILNSIVLIAAILLICGISVNAEIIVDDENAKLSGYGMVLDDFDTTGVTEETWIADYPGTAYESDVINCQNDSYNNRDMTLSPGNGVDGTTALKVGVSYEGSRSLRVLSKYIDFSSEDTLIDGMTAVMNYDIRITSNPNDTYLNDMSYLIGIGHWFTDESNALFKLQKDESGKFFFVKTGSQDSEKLYYELDKWYTVQLVQRGSTQEGYIIDKENDTVLLSNVKTKAPQIPYTGQYFTALYLHPGYTMLEGETANTDHNMGFIAYLDNMKISIFNTNDSPELIKSSIEDSDIKRNENIVLRFNSIIPEADIILKAGETELIQDIDYKVLPIGILDKKIVMLKLLEKNTEYTLQFANTEISDITFTTKSEYVLSFECLDNEISATGTRCSIKLIDESGLQKISCDVVAVLYEEVLSDNISGYKMIGADRLNLVEKNFNEEIVLEYDFDVNIPNDYKISLVCFEKGKWIPISAEINLN